MDKLFSHYWMWFSSILPGIYSFGGIVQEQVVLSHKFSGATTRWPNIEKEAYAIFFGVKKLEYLLICAYHM